MWLKQTALVFCLGLIVFLCATCAKPEYWVKGLTLPPGSTGVTTVDGDMGAGMGQVPMVGKIKRTKAVSFSNSGGWDAVVNHLDRCLTRQGYTNSMAGIDQMAAGSGFSFGNTMRWYEKGGSKYSVMVMNMSASMAEAAKATGQSMPGNMGSMGLGEFMLAIYETE